MTAHSFREQILQRSAQKCTVFVLAGPGCASTGECQPPARQGGFHRLPDRRCPDPHPLTMWVIHTPLTGNLLSKYPEKPWMACRQVHSHVRLRCVYFIYTQNKRSMVATVTASPHNNLSTGCPGPAHHQCNRPCSPTW